MGIFKTIFSVDESDQEQIRGIPDNRLAFVPSSNLLFVAVARLMEAEGVDDKKLIEELYKRGRAQQ